MESVSLMPFLSWISNWFYLQEGRLINKRCQSVYRRTPTSVRMRSSPLYFWWRNPSSPDVVMKALFRILEPQNRVERNTYFVFAHDFVLALRYLHFFPLLTDMTDSTKYIWRFLFTDGRSSITKRVFVSQCDKTVNKDWVKGQGSISMTAHKCEHLLHFRSWLVLALRYLHFFPLLTDMTDSTKYIWRFLFTDGRSSITKRVFVSQCDKTVNKDWVKGQGSVSMTAHKCEITEVWVEWVFASSCVI